MDDVKKEDWLFCFGKLLLWGKVIGNKENFWVVDLWFVYEFEVVMGLNEFYIINLMRFVFLFI